MLLGAPQALARAAARASDIAAPPSTASSRCRRHLSARLRRRGSRSRGS